MKKLFFYPVLLLLLFVSAGGNAQTVITADQVTPAFLKETFETP
ncbi:hypothetical protein [Flavobacterium sp. 3HN19-14]